MSDSPVPSEPLPSKVIIDRSEPVTVTTVTTTSKGFEDILPSLIPALQSSSYVLVILAAFLAWSSRKLVTNFLDRHIELMQTVKESLEAERINNDKQLAVLSHLTQSNVSLTSALQALASGANRRSETSETSETSEASEASETSEASEG